MREWSGGAAGAGVFDEGGEVAAGAVGLDEFLVDAEAGEGEGVFGADEVEEGDEAGELVGGGGLKAATGCRVRGVTASGFRGRVAVLWMEMRMEVPAQGAARAIGNCTV